tara:strand:- start:63 stop:341 length:279 start_codon:yes stop_codon:yes gene_type:complete
MSVNITEHLAINKNHDTDDIEVLVMVEGSDFVHKTDIKVSDWTDYLYYGYNGKSNAQNKQGRFRSTLEYVRLQDWTWTATDKKHPSTYCTDD